MVMMVVVVTVVVVVVMMVTFSTKRTGAADGRKFLYDVGAVQM